MFLSWKFEQLTVLLYISFFSESNSRICDLLHSLYRKQCDHCIFCSLVDDINELRNEVCHDGLARNGWPEIQAITATRFNIIQQTLRPSIGPSLKKESIQRTAPAPMALEDLLMNY